MKLAVSNRIGIAVGILNIAEYLRVWIIFVSIVFRLFFLSISL